jgi:hypothetical protein
MLDPGLEPKVLIADKSYDADAIRDDLLARKVEPVIAEYLSLLKQRSIMFLRA